jgi:hypothetical protein
MAATQLDVPITNVTLGHVLALAWSPSDERLYVLDETRAGRHGAWHAESARLISIPFGGGRARVEANWRRLTANVEYALAVDVFGDVWIAASRREQAAAHTVLRLTRDRHGEWRSSSTVGAGGIHRDQILVNDRGVSLAVGEGPTARIVGYERSDLRDRGGDDRCF